MTSFHKEEEPNLSKRCNFFKSTLKHFAFANFHTPLGRLPSPSPDEEVDPISDDDQEVLTNHKCLWLISYKKSRIIVETTCIQYSYTLH